MTIWTTSILEFFNKRRRKKTKFDQFYRSRKKEKKVLHLLSWS